MSDELATIRARINNARERAGFSAHYRGPVELVIIERDDLDVLASIADHYCDIIEAARVLVTSKRLGTVAGIHGRRLTEREDHP